MKKIILTLFAGILFSCNNFKSNKSVDTFVDSDLSIIRFIKLYESFIDATYEWHKVSDYNINVNIQQKCDTLIYRFDADNPNDIWPQIEDCKYCYTIDNHKIFSNQKLLSIKSMSVDSVLRIINPKQYLDYKKNKTPQPPECIWDTQGLKVVYVKNQLRNVKFVWALE